ncbi:MAG: hypothetical protein PHY59_04260 [Methanobacterium sp.]|nr:hypothetical protein [Methanobacterium sp.]
MRDKFWIIFIVLLMVSITPASASMINGSGDDLKDQNNRLQKDMKGVTQHVDNVKGYWDAILRYILNIWHCLCFIAANIGIGGIGVNYGIISVKLE